MRLLVDTHLLIWSALTPARLSSVARNLLDDPANALVFSVTSLWEIAIKLALGRQDFDVDPHVLRRGLTDNGWEELPITGAHALAFIRVPVLHKDPFDRLLVAQAETEGITLLTADAGLARYSGAVRLV